MKILTRRSFKLAEGWMVIAMMVTMAELLPAEPVQDFADYRKVLVSPTVNTPETFPGFGGFCGWPKVVRLQNGDLFVSFQAGYWHASWPTPLDFPPDYLKKMTQANPVLKEWHEKNKAPDGGRNFWIRSKDNGKTWTRPRPFPQVRGAEGIECLIQMTDGILFAAHNVEEHRGWIRTDLSQGLPTDPLEFSKIAADRFPQPFVVHRSDDNGESWRVIARLTGPFIFSVAVQGLMEDPRDGGLVALASGTAVPVGENWPPQDGHVLALLKSLDKGETWKTTSVFKQQGPGDEKNVGYLSDGSMAMASRPFSEWIQSSDHGLTWSQPRRLLEGPGDSKARLMKRGELIQGPDGLSVLVFCGGLGGNGQVIYSRDHGKTWIKPAPDRGFTFDPRQYYPNACVLDDGSIFAVGVRQRIKNEFGPFGAETLAMRFRIKSSKEGEGIEILPIGGPEITPEPAGESLRWRPTRPKLVHDNQGKGTAACIIRLRDGSLIASIASEPQAESTAVTIIESTDDGKTWGNAFTADVPVPDMWASDISMGLMNDGRIVMLCTQSLGENLGSSENKTGAPLPKLRRFIGKLPDGREYQAYENYRIHTAIHLAYSADRGRTWTAGPTVDEAPLLGAWTWTGGRPAQLSDGTLVLPVTGYLSQDDMDGIRQSCGVLRKEADGGDWSFSLIGRSNKDNGMVFSEPSMARLGDGRLVFMIRTQNRSRDASKVPADEQRGLYHSISDDGGKTWSPRVRVLAGTHCSIVELGDGKLLCGWHRPVRYAVSSEAGRTWSKPEPWFIGTDSPQGTYTNVEFVDGKTAVAMIRDEKKRHRLWACQLRLTVESPGVSE